MRRILSNPFTISHPPKRPLTVAHPKCLSHRIPSLHRNDRALIAHIRPPNTVGTSRGIEKRGEGLICECQSIESTSPGPKEIEQPSNEGQGLWIILATVALLGIGVYSYFSSHPMIVALKSQVMASWLGKSGFIAALSLIFISEIGDKTFFIAALLSMRLGRWISFIGTTIALGLTSILSVAIGTAFKAVPDAIKQSVPVGEYLGVALLLFFGVRSLSTALSTEPDSGVGGEGDGELADAEDALREAEESGKVVGNKRWKSLVEVITLLFVGEWGDRSMLATIALGAAQNPVGVAVGAIVAHVLAAAIAVLSGSLASKYISERAVNLMGGVLFLVFAVATIFGFA